MNFEAWENWEPTERATLCFVIRNQEILLIRKKRGLGAGKINGPGGRLEAGETPLECAVRETQEELGVTPYGVEQCGELYFQFLDDYRLHCSVFKASDIQGEAIETEEAIPLWTPLHAIPFHEMWADDICWLPGMLEGGAFRGFFEFEGDILISKHVIWEDVQFFSSCNPL